MKTTLLLLIASLVGCANPINAVTYGRYTQEGDAAMARGDFVAAEMAYARAAQNVDWGLLGQAAKSGSLFNLANAKIRLGKFAEAEPLLLDSLSIEESISGSEVLLSQKRYLGLAIVYLELDQPMRGLPYLKRTLKFSGPAEVTALKSKLYPAYVEKLERLGKTSEAALFRTQ